jgi:L-ascorbate metabolism protein UlaG (beta-lactamase superfamily)
MEMTTNCLWMILLVAGMAFGQVKRPVDEGMTDQGPVRLTVINHASLMIEHGSQVIHVDPVGAGRYEGLPQADLILITHAHSDHLDAAAVAKLSKPGTVVLGPEIVAKSLPGTTIIRNGETKTVGPTTVEAVPAYNLKRGPSPGTLYHPKGVGNGYVTTFAGRRCYIAGDTEAIPEMKLLKDIEVAFLPMNLPYTMTPQEAAEAALSFMPKVVYPYHDRGTDLAVFQKALEGSGIQVRIRDWYY